MTAALLLPGVLSFSGCASGSRARTPDISAITPQQIQARVARNFSKLRTFEGKARVIIELPGEGYQGSSSVYLAFPDSIFIKTEAILGIDVGALFLDSRIFGAYAPRDNVLYYGEASSLDLQDFLQVKIETHELREVLTGLSQINLDGDATLALDDGRYLLTGSRGAENIRYWVDPRRFVVVRSEARNAEGQVVMRAEFNRLKSNHHIVLPQTIKVTRPLARERLTVYYTKQKVNKGIAPGRFRLKTAKNARRVYWGNVLKRRQERTQN